MLNAKYEIQKIDYPYDIWIIDDFLDLDVLRKIKISWEEIPESNWHNGYEKINGRENILEKRMSAISKLDLMPPYLQEVLKYFHSVDFTKILSDITGVNNLIPDSTMRWSGLRVMHENSFQLVHSDARKNPSTFLTKELTCILYLNQGYVKERDQGCLEIWDDSMENKTHEIEPLDNRMIIFVNSDTSYHGVPRVNKKRRSILFSVMSENSSSDRSKALFVPRPEDPEEVKNIGKERSEIKDNHK